MNDALQRLRAANPVPSDPGAPPIDDVRTRIAAADRPAPARRTRRRWSLGSAASAVGALAVVAVVVGVVLAIHVRSQPASSPAALTGGMRGIVDPLGSGLDGETGWVWFTRCLGKCDGFSEHRDNWLATTTDGGSTWAVARRRRLLIPPVSGSGQDLWAGTVGEQGNGAAVVTHDGGVSWRTVDVPHSPNFYSVSVAGGEAWAVGSGCSGICGGAILHGPATGSQLEPTLSTPQHPGGAPQIVAVSTTSAYLYVPFGAGHLKAWATVNGGRGWSQVAPGCPSEVIDGSGTGAIWRSCRPSDGHATVGISTDGGRHWVYRPASFSPGVLYPSSARIAWAETSTGATMRTTDGGRSWRAVWTPSSNHAHLVALSAQSSSTATETVPVAHTQDGIRRTNFVVYRTTDGGEHWRQTAVALPPR